MITIVKNLVLVSWILNSLNMLKLVCFVAFIAVVNCGLNPLIADREADAARANPVVTVDAEGSGTGCSCEVIGGCGCCVHVEVPFFANAEVCGNITTYPGTLTFGADLYWGNYTIFNDTFSGNNPKPICGTFGGLLPAGLKMCWDFYGIGFTDNGFEVCAKIELKEHFIQLWHLDFGCLVIPDSSEWTCEYHDGNNYCVSKCDGRMGTTDGFNYLDLESGEQFPVENVNGQFYYGECQIGAEEPKASFNLMEIAAEVEAEQMETMF